MKITFIEEETKCLNLNHDDALVVSMRMINALGKRVMIDICSSIDILYFNAFQKLGLSANNLSPIESSLMVFMGDFIYPLGTISLHITFDEEPCSKIVMTKFIVVKILLAYNVIIGQPTLNRLNAMMTYYMVMKFSRRTDVGKLKSNPRESR